MIQTATPRKLGVVPCLWSRGGPMFVASDIIRYLRVLKKMEAKAAPDQSHKDP